MRRKGVLAITVLLAIFLFQFVSAVTLISESNVSYDSELRLQFLFNKWVPVIVKITDTSNIVISNGDSIEVQTAKDNEKKEILGNITNSVISTLSKDEFQLEGIFPMGNGFYGTSTKEGFRKLLRDERVRKVYDTEAGHINSISTVKNLGFYLMLIVVLIVISWVLFKLKKGKWKSKK